MFCHEAETVTAAKHLHSGCGQRVLGGAVFQTHDAEHVVAGRQAQRLQHLGFAFVAALLRLFHFQTVAAEQDSALQIKTSLSLCRGQTAKEEER